MKTNNLSLKVTFLALVIIAASAVAQPAGGRRGGPPPARGREGPGTGPGGIEQVVDTLNLSAGKRQSVLDDIRAYQANVRGLADFASAGVIVKMKEILTPDDFTKFKTAVDTLRSSNGGTRALITVDVVDRVMSFDKDKTGKVKIDDLPERMQPQVSMGDLNGDGMLDRDELLNLVSDNPRVGPGRGGGPPPALGGNNRGGGGGRGGRGGGPGPVGGLNATGLDRIIGNLNLSGAAREAANSALMSYEDNVRKLAELSRADLLLKVSAVLSADEYTQFAALVGRTPAILDRPALVRGTPPPGRVGGPGGPGGRRGGTAAF